MSKPDANGETVSVDVLLLSTYDTDGAGKFTHQLAASLQGLGYTTRVVCVQNRSGDEKTLGIIDNRPIQQLRYRLSEEVDRRVIRPRPEYAFIHMRALPDQVALASNAWPDDCKLIVCTFLSGMISPSALLDIHRRYGFPTVVLNGVDMNFYTAGCHYAQNCIGFLQECTACPAVPRFARKKVMDAFREKKGCYAKLNPLVIASSHEQYEQLTRSSLLKNARIEKILMAVDDQLFGKYEAARGELKKTYGFNNRTMLIRSSSEPRKGCDIFVRAIREISSEIPGFLSNMTIVAIGDQFIANQLSGVDVKLISLGYIADEEELSRMYTIADVFLMTSIADSGPVMLAQSLMSGTPVISTDVGMARDLIFPKRNGEVLASPSAGVLKDSIVSFLCESDEVLGRMRCNARELAQMQFSKSVYMVNLEKLVNKILIPRVRESGQD